MNTRRAQETGMMFFLAKDAERYALAAARKLSLYQW